MDGSRIRKGKVAFSSENEYVWTGPQTICPNFTFLLGLIDVLSANQHAEIFACILLLNRAARTRIKKAAKSIGIKLVKKRRRKRQKK